MVFSSAIFLLVFLPITYILNLLIPNKFSNFFLLISSLLFYAWGEPIYVFLMIFSIVINWIVGRKIDHSNGRKKKIWLVLGVSCDIGILLYYKYSAFIVSIINKIATKQIIETPSIILPIGISFFTFQAISYIADVYKGDTDSSSKLINTALYISFFPQLIAGPIVKYKDINLQIEDRKVTVDGFVSGFKRFIYGLSKKVLISNILGQYVDVIYANGIDTLDCKTAWICALAYTFQIYYDFSGYSDMAIGLGKMFGFNILENFNYPYLSKSISEFWRKWHISLGSWFREYVYIPLGGNKKGTLKTYINLVIVFFLTGLWHGADFSFILWGLYHGFFSIIERLGLNTWLKKSKIISTIYCFLIVNFGWVLFRANNTTEAVQHIVIMLFPFRYNNGPLQLDAYFNIKFICMFVFAVLGAGILKNCVPEKTKKKWNGSIVEALYCVFIMLLSIASIASDTYNPFIYFQF